MLTLDILLNKFEMEVKLMKKLIYLMTFSLFLIFCGRARTPAIEKSYEGAGLRRMVLSSPAFLPGGKIPVQYTGDGADMSPELVWDSVPEGVKSFALICSDPDAPLGTFIHWVVYNIPAEVRRLPENLPKVERLEDGSTQGVNSFQRIGYNGPKPPPGKPHHYFFYLYALDTVLKLSPAASAGTLREAMNGHIIGQAELMGIYGR